MGQAINRMSLGGKLTSCHNKELRVPKQNQIQCREKGYVETMNVKFMTAEDAVNQVIEMYIESMEKSSGDMVTEAFHENAKVVGYLNGDFLQLSTSDFAGFVSAQEPGTVEFEILSCEVNGDTATAKVRDKYLGISFLDSLSLVKEGDKWSIYNKLFHVEA